MIHTVECTSTATDATEYSGVVGGNRKYRREPKYNKIKRVIYLANMCISYNLHSVLVISMKRMR